MFDTLYLVAAGYCVYHGPALQVLPFFSSVGFHCEEHDNPADFVLDVCQGDRLPALEDASAQAPVSAENFSIETYLNEAYVKSQTYQSITHEIGEANQTNRTKSDLRQVENKSMLREIFYVSQRTLRNAFRNPQLTILQSSMSIVLGVLIGLIYLRLDKSTVTGIGNRRGAIFFIVTNQVFSNLSALELFIKERVLFVHENVSGYYHVITYFASKLLCDILPLRTIPAVSFSIITYFMMGFQAKVENFFIFFFGIWLTSVCASSLCFLVSASVRNYGMKLTPKTVSSFFL